MVGAGPTFIFPTASKDLLSQDTWQVGPDAGAVLLGKHFIAYAFVQQWFKVGGDGRDTNQMNGTFNFTYLFANGWTIGTQPTLSVDWEAPEVSEWHLRSDHRWEDVQMRRPADVVPVAGSVLPRFVQTSPVRSGTFSCKRLRRFRPSSRKRSSELPWCPCIDPGSNNDCAE